METCGWAHIMTAEVFPRFEPSFALAGNGGSFRRTLPRRLDFSRMEEMMKSGTHGSYPESPKIKYRKEAGRPAPNELATYCNSFKTSCCCWLPEPEPICRSVPGWSIVVRLATTDRMFAPLMVFSAEVRFCTWLLMTCGRSEPVRTLAPTWPRTLGEL